MNNKQSAALVGARRGTLDKAELARDGTFSLVLVVCPKGEVSTAAQPQYSLLFFVFDLFTFLFARSPKSIKRWFHEY